MRSSSETICSSSEPASRRVTRNTPTLRPLQISGSAAAAPTPALAAPSRQASERGSLRKSLLTHTFWSRKAWPQTPEPSGGIGDDRNIDAAQPRDVVAEAGGKPSSWSPAPAGRRPSPGSPRWKTRLRRPFRTVPLAILRTGSLRWSRSTPQMYARLSSAKFSAPAGILCLPPGDLCSGRPKWTLLAVTSCNSE